MLLLVAALRILPNGVIPSLKTRSQGESCKSTVQLWVFLVTIWAAFKWKEDVKEKMVLWRDTIPGTWEFPQIKTVL